MRVLYKTWLICLCASVGFFATPLSAQAQSLDFKVSLKKTDIVAGEPLIVLVDENGAHGTSASTRIEGQQEWIKVDIIDASGRYAPSSTYKMMTTKNSMNDYGAEDAEPNKGLHLEHVVRKSRNALLPGAYTVRVHIYLPYHAKGASKVSVADQSSEFALHVSPYNEAVLRQQAEAYYKTVVTPTRKSTSWSEIKEAQRAVDALFALPDAEARPVWFRLMKNKPENVLVAAKIWPNVMRVASNPGFQNELKALLTNTEVDESQRALLNQYIESLKTYNKALSGNYPNFDSVGVRETIDE